MNKDKKTLAIRIFLFALIVVAIVVIMRVVVKASMVTGKYDSFATCLVKKDLKFFGAFWCPHCQAQKREFGGSAKLLPYIECSTPDGQGVKPICQDNKIEGYPTWVYPQAITVEGAGDPTICDILPGGPTQPASCAQNGSKFFKTWVFSGVKVMSGQEPTHTGSAWTFAPGSRTQGEVSIDNLSKFSGCELPAAK